MSDIQFITNNTTTEKIELQTFDLPKNYSILINKLEKLALGLDSAFGNLTLDRKHVEIAVSDSSINEEFLGASLAAEHTPAPYAHPGGMGEVEYSRVVSDIWIGVILTLLIVSVIFFICSCFLYHKFQQWKNSYHTGRNEPVEICRHYPEFEAESLPSYTIVSGLPTYDAALEEFRKAGIILTPPSPVIKIFDSDSKDANIINMENVLNDFAMGGGSNNDGDNISLSSTCTCGGGGGGGGVGSVSGSGNNSSTNTMTPNNSAINLSMPGGSSAATQIIELSPEQLASLSHKRLSLQIAFNNSVRRSSRPRIDLYREANRNNHLRSRVLSNAGLEHFPQIHRSSSTLSLSPHQNLHHLRHRGSLY